MTKSSIASLCTTAVECVRRPAGTFRLRALAAVLIVTGFVTSSFAQTHDRRSLAQDLTSQLVSLNAQIHSAAAADRSQLLDEMADVVSARRELLKSLLVDDPGAVLAVAVPSNIREKFPLTTQVLLEKEQQIDGELEIAVEDAATGSKIHYGLKTAAGRLSLHFAQDPPMNLLTGSHVRVSGVRLDSGLALQSGSTTTSSNTSFQALALAAPNTFGAQSTAVILVNFQDNTSQPYTPATAYDVVFNATSNYDRENSYQQTWLTGDVYGWFTVAMSSSVCDQYTLGSLADQAATKAGVNLSQYTRKVYMFPLNACSFWGYGTIGGTPSQAWINGQVIPPDVRVVSHEMGHNFGLYHSHDLNCGSSIICSNGTVDEYGDTLDTMGNPNYYMGGDFNAFQKSRLGWLAYGSSPAVTTVQSSGSYTIGPYESQDSTAKALKIVQSKTNNTFYWVEYRTAQGFDSFLSGNTNVLNGVIVHQASDSDGNSSDLLNMNPSGGSFAYPALTVGQSFTDSAAGVTITPVAVSSTGAMVNVTLNGTTTATCTHATPSISLSPSQSQYVNPGSTVTYSVTIQNNDSTACSSALFTLTANVPSGWTSAFGSSGITLNPGGSSSTSLQVTSPTNAAAGLYSIGATVIDSAATSYSNSTSATYAINAPTSTGPVAVFVTTNQSTYTGNASVGITTTVTSGGAPVAGASVTLNILKPNGATVSQSATTSNNGIVTVTYRIKAKDPHGVYQVTASASVASSPAVQATTSFTVQ